MTLLGLLVVKMTSVPRFYDWFVICNLTLGPPPLSGIAIVKMSLDDVGAPSPRQPNTSQLVCNCQDD